MEGQKGLQQGLGWVKQGEATFFKYNASPFSLHRCSVWVLKSERLVVREGRGEPSKQPIFFTHTYVGRFSSGKTVLSPSWRVGFLRPASDHRQGRHVTWILPMLGRWFSSDKTVLSPTVEGGRVSCDQPQIPDRDMAPVTARLVALEILHWKLDIGHWTLDP